MPPLTTLRRAIPRHSNFNCGSCATRSVHLHYLNYHLSLTAVGSSGTKNTTALLSRHHYFVTRWFSGSSGSRQTRRPRLKVVRDRGKKRERREQSQPAEESTKTQISETAKKSQREKAYQKDKYTVIAQRAAPLIALGILMNSEFGSGIFHSYMFPSQIEQLWGPSMLPSIHPFGDIFLHTTPMWDSVRQWYHKLKSLVWGKPSPMYTAGEIIIWKNPDTGQRACKRIIGMEGDTVQRYGQFAEYFQHRPDTGILWDSKAQTRGLDPSCPWDVDKTMNEEEDKEEICRTLIVPAGHVWLEGDNPLLSVDSRHYGPIPEEWLQGRLIWRLWPLLRHPAIRKHDQLLRRHRNIRPKPLDLETIPRRDQEDRLALYYNLHRPNQQPMREQRPEAPKTNPLSNEQKEKFKQYRFD